MIDFGTADRFWWDGKNQEARHYVRNDDQRVLCRISMEALEDNFGDQDNEEACLAVAKEHFDDLTDAWREKIANRSFEEDGSVLLRSADL